MEESIKKLLAGLVFMFVTVFAFSAFAGEFADLKSKVNEARDTLVTMVKNKDKRGADQQKLVKDTADAVSAALSKLKAPAGKEAQFKELSDNWNAFKKTREEELVPLLIAGKDAKAKAIALGIQKERLKKVLDNCDALIK
ncbi:MAG: hypothetical protein ACE5DW_06165 [Thermodesulfobacteriota bacterium]